MMGPGNRTVLGPERVELALGGAGEDRAAPRVGPRRAPRSLVGAQLTPPAHALERRVEGEDLAAGAAPVEGNDQRARRERRPPEQAPARGEISGDLTARP